ncbi:M23 family metallopeptidase [Eubacteriales bacterium OttesenSCG-928-G02]|nr:M23 family metallopeptidase [Eubacteriales bacterium OttesenSCG-928-G02]
MRYPAEIPAWAWKTPCIHPAQSSHRNPHGIVVVANSSDSWGGGWGYYVKIKHNDTYSTLYAHASRIAVINGQEVKKGQVIAYVGTTGNSTGNHLHFEVYKDGSRTNPLGYFD